MFGDPWGVYEEYWYDALGRRVLKRSRQESPICTYTTPSPGRCYSAVERYVWDGAQILWEFRQANAGDTKDPNPTPSNGQTGHVGYVHAGGIDMPLGMIRNDTAVVLQRDHRGLYRAATTTAGGSLGANVPWPSTSWDVSQNAFYPRVKHTWLGSLPLGHLDHTGLLYRRNRYYDPVSGQFTQPDPIGFAGGFNLYGYAGGDPINGRDPFGLDPECEGSWDEEDNATLTCPSSEGGEDIECDIGAEDCTGSGMDWGLLRWTTVRGAVTVALAALYSVMETGVSGSYGLINMSGRFRDGGVDVSEPNLTVPAYGVSIDRIININPDAGPTTGYTWLGIGPHLGFGATYSRGPNGRSIISSAQVSIGVSVGPPAGGSAPISQLFRR